MDMSTFATEGVAEANVSLVVTRCTCAPGEMNHPGSPCPNGRVEDLGVVGYWHHKRHKRIIYAIKRKLLGI